jgi:hypothetical protein
LASHRQHTGMSPITRGVISKKSTFGNRLAIPRGMLRNEATVAFQAVLSCQIAASSLQESTGQRPACMTARRVMMYRRNLVILLGRRTCSFYAIPIVVPTLNSTQTVIYKADSMWLALLYLPEVVLVAVCSGWMPALGRWSFEEHGWVRNDRGTVFDSSH